MLTDAHAEQAMAPPSWVARLSENELAYGQVAFRESRMPPSSFLSMWQSRISAEQKEPASPSRRVRNSYVPQAR